MLINAVIFQFNTIPIYILKNMSLQIEQTLCELWKILYVIFLNTEVYTTIAINLNVISVLCQ